MAVLSNIRASLRGDSGIAASRFWVSPGGLAGQVSRTLVTTSVGTRTAPGSASHTVSPARLSRVTDEVNPAPATFAPRWAAPLIAAVEPWLVPTSHTGTL